MSAHVKISSFIKDKLDKIMFLLLINLRYSVSTQSHLNKYYYFVIMFYLNRLGQTAEAIKSSTINKLNYILGKQSLMYENNIKNAFNKTKKL